MAHCACWSVGRLVGWGISPLGWSFIPSPDPIFPSAPAECGHIPSISGVFPLKPFTRAFLEEVSYSIIILVGWVVLLFLHNYFVLYYKDSVPPTPPMTWILSSIDPKIRLSNEQAISKSQVTSLPKADCQYVHTCTVHGT